MTFVKNGGGLFMISDHTGADRNNDGEDAVEILNDLMTNNSVDSGTEGSRLQTSFVLDDTALNVS